MLPGTAEENEGMKACLRTASVDGRPWRQVGVVTEAVKTYTLLAL